MYGCLYRMDCNGEWNSAAFGMGLAIGFVGRGETRVVEHIGLEDRGSDK